MIPEEEREKGEGRQTGWAASDLAAVVALRISISRASSSADATSSPLPLLLAAAGTISDEEDKLALSQKVLLTETKLQNYLKIKELEVFSEGGGEPEERKYN